MKVQVSVDKCSYDKKPESGKELGRMKYRIAERWREMEISELADLVGNKGHAMIPAHLVDGISAKNSIAMQLFTLDFDHQAHFSEVKRKCDELGLPISFAYHTYSSSEEEERFRVVFAYNCLVDDPFIMKVIIMMLHKIFSDKKHSCCDPACTNLDRMFFGGKELIYIDENAHIALVQLLFLFFDCLNADGNFTRNIRSFCRKYNILLINNRPAMGSMDMLSAFEKIDENMDSAIIHEIGKSTNSSFFIIESSVLHRSDTCKKRKKKLQIDSCYGCQLLHDFMTGEDLDHNAKFAIITNLLYVNGGQKCFLDVLERGGDTESYKKWKKNLYYLRGYLPTRCSEQFCLYCQNCENAGTIVDTLALDRKVYRQPEQYYSIDEAYQCLLDNLNEAFLSDKIGIHMIKGQTAIGKTTAYMELLVKHPETRFLIAVPTNKLKEQIKKDLLSSIDEKEIFVTASVRDNCFISEEVQNLVSEAHDRGIHYKTREIVSELYDEIEHDPDKAAVVKEYEKILNGMEGIKEERIVITTHAYFAQLSKEFLSNYTIIIDEDFLYLQIFARTYHISVDCLKELSEKRIPGYSGIAGKMLNAEYGEYKKISETMNCPPLSEEQLDEIETFGYGNNINDLGSAGAFVKIKDKKTDTSIVRQLFLILMKSQWMCHRAMM